MNTTLIKVKLKIRKIDIAHYVKGLNCFKITYFTEKKFFKPFLDTFGYKIMLIN